MLLALLNLFLALFGPFSALFDPFATLWVKFPLPLPLSVSASSAHGSQYPTICATLEGGYVNGGNVHGDYENMIGKDPPKKPGPGDDNDIDTIHELMMTILVVLTTHGALKTTCTSSTYDTIFDCPSHDWLKYQFISN